MSEDENLLRTKCAEVAAAVFYHNNDQNQKHRLESALVALAQFLCGDDARLVAENAMPVEDELSHYEYMARKCEECELTDGDGNVLADMLRRADETDKRTAALQAELDRANALIEQVRQLRWGPFGDSDIVSQLGRIVRPERELRAPSPDTPRPAVVITDEHRRDWLTLKPYLAGWATVQTRDAHKSLDSLFAEPS